MSATRPLTWIIAALLLLNAVGMILILLELREPDESTAAAVVIEPPDATDSVNRVKADAETSAEAPVQAGTESSAEIPLQAPADIEQAVTDPSVLEKPPADPVATEIVIARVKGIDIGQTLLVSYLNQIAPPEQLAQWNTLDDVPENILAQSIDNAALDNLLVQLAMQSKLDQNPAIQANIEQSNRNILKTAFLNQLAPGLVDDQDIATRYATLVASLEGKLEYRARHILLANEKEAIIVDRALAEKKKSFDELAKLFSLDDSTSHRGGDLGYVLEGQLNPEFETEIEPLAIGQISKPFKTELGWHIAIVDDRREAQPMPLAQATPVIRRKLEQQAIQRYLADLLESADIEVLVSFEQVASD